MNDLVLQLEAICTQACEELEVELMELQEQNHE